MWDLVVITAGNERQAEDFRHQLEVISLAEFAKEVKVFADPPEKGRIGSGGSTLFVIDNLTKEYGESLLAKKVLLLHSGGLSQRMPHLSAFGKLFAHLPGPTTALELKLNTYRRFPSLLPAGLMIAASDVIEDTRKLVDKVDDAVEMVLFATESDEQTASQHGVFVMEDGNLMFVLQKPTVEEMRTTGAVREDGSVLTDCFFWMNWPLSQKLSALLGARPIEAELCCYGDFMRSLGSQPKLDYLKQGNENIQLWRKDFASIFQDVQPQVVNLGKEAFFHLGTPSELLEHFEKESAFFKKFISSGENAVYSRVQKIENGSFIEFCDLKDCAIGSGCILSGLKSTVPLEIPKNVMMFTLTTTEGFATFAFGINDDIKKKQDELMWMGHKTKITGHSLWTAPLFPIEKSKESSLLTTLEMITRGINGFYESKQLTSLESAVKSANLLEMINERKEMKKNFKL